VPIPSLLPVVPATPASVLTKSSEAASRLTNQLSYDGTAAYSYDPTGQLISATYDPSSLDESYTYDANGNRVTANGCVYATGADNELLSDGTYRYAYDADGNRTARFIDVNLDGVLDSGDTNVTEYKWDARNRLIEVTERAAFGGTATEAVDYLYDVENRWIGENVKSPLPLGEGQGEGELLPEPASVPHAEGKSA